MQFITRMYPLCRVLKALIDTITLEYTVGWDHDFMVSQFSTYFIFIKDDKYIFRYMTANLALFLPKIYMRNVYWEIFRFRVMILSASSKYWNCFNFHVWYVINCEAMTSSKGEGGIHIYFVYRDVLFRWVTFEKMGPLFLKNP